MHKRKRKSGEAKKSEAAVSKQKSNINAVNVAAVENDNDDNQQDDNDDYLHMYDDEEGGTRVGDIYIPPPIKPYCLTESKGPRLIIKKIVNENFKSFAGEVNIGPFHQRFTAIIGPNGSGKSNVIDSMLFVFGFRAQKLRCKKLSSLVHNSAKFPKQEMCKVSIHFKKIIDKQDGGFEDVPDSEFVVSRTAFRDDSSYYLINDRRSKLKDVAKLLKNHGIDLDHNRFLILQGDVESIALMKPKSLVPKDYGMLEYLEDIIGTTRYKQPLEQINNRVETLTEERTEKHNRCKLAEREMKDLEDPYKEAINFLEKENVFKRAQNLKYQKTLSGLNHKLEECGKEMDGIQKELQEHDDKVNELSKEKEEKEKLIKDSNINYSKLCKTKEEMEQNLTKASNNYTETQNTMVAMNKRRKQNQEQIQKLESKLEDLIKVPKQNEGEIHDCEKKVEKLTTDKKKYEEELQKNYALIEDQTRPHIEKREKLETILIDKKKIAGEAKAELSLAESELQILQHDETNEKRKYESLKSSLEDSKKELEQKQNEFDEIKASIPKMKDEMNKKTIELMDCKKEQKTLHNQLLTYKAEIAEKKSNMQMATSNNKVLDSLMKQKYEGHIPGILGRLGDLGGIDAKYDVAISTACGRLDNIVCDTVDTAQACIEHLKRHDVGRASFIALEKVQHLQQQCRSKINTPENVPRLFDLVRVEDERVLPAFYFALGNTLVANDLDQGTRIAYGRVRYRVVTLRGDLIETSGTMSGGGTIQMRGKMGQKVKTQTNKRSLDTTSAHGKKDLEQLELKTEKVQNRINYLQEQEGQLEREINQLKNELINKEKEEKKLTVTIRSFTEQLPRIEVMLKSQKERMDKTHADQTKVKQLEKKINTMRKNTENSEKIANEISEKISQINNEISKIHGDKIKSVQDKINSITKQMKNLNANISKLKVEITTSERNVQKTKKQIEDLKEEIKNAEKNVLELKDKRIEYEQEQKELEQKITVIKQEIEQIEKSTSNVRSEISAIQKMENEMKLKRVEIEEKMLQMKNKITDIKRHLPSINKKLSELKLNEIPGRVVNETDMILKTYTEEELNTYKLQDLEYECKELEEDLRSKKPNFSAISEYLNKRETYLQRVKILENVTSQRNEMRQLYEDVKKKRYTEFMHGFTIITKKLKEMYQMITQGGDAELELVDSMDPFNEGVSFSVRPPKKTWKNISNLSGGEKTLSSLALVFALHYYKPSPLYFMDEIDAALDFKNVSIVAHYIKERTKNSQFIIISLRPNMFELSDYIVGIYKVNDCTSALAVRNCPPDTTETIIQQTEKENDQNNHQSQLQQQIHINNNQNEKEQQIILDTSKEQQLETDEQNESIRQQLANQTEIELDETNLEKDQTEIELDQTELESEQQEKEQEKQQSEEEDQQQQQQEQQQNEDKQ